MSPPFFALLLLLACVARPAPAAAQPPRLYLTTEYSPPASMLAAGEVIGLSTEKVREVMQRSGVLYSVELLPWKRAYTAALQRADACVFSTTRTPEREALFKWVGPTDEADWVLLGRADRNLQLRSLEDARTLRIGTYNGDARDEYLRARGFLVDSAPNDTLNPKKLLMNRIDLWAAGLRPGSAVIAQNGWGEQIVPLLTFNHIKVYLACNRAVPDALIEKMNGALEAMARDGTTRRIDRKYDNWFEQAGPLQ
ncbi:MAG: ABC transporter substrate-binding protein [Pseudomonadota bacterium]